MIRVVRVSFEPLNRIIHLPAYGEAEMIAEGFPGMAPADFVAMFCGSHRGCHPHTEITRIEFQYED